MLDPRRLNLLIALESLGTVRAVAEAASMSPSAVSQQLATLESESGAALLERHGRAVALTDAGVALAAHARAILERIGAAEEDLRARQNEPAGTVRIAAFTSAMRGFVIAAAATAGRAHPGIDVHLSELEPDDCVPALARGEVDLAVVADFGDGSLPHAPQLRRIPLSHDALHAVLPAGHPFAGGDLGALRDDPWLLDGTELERHVVRRCRRAGFEPRVAGRLFSHESLLYAVRSGLGVTVLPTFALDRADGVEVRPLDGARRELAVLHREGALNRRSVALALGLLIEAGHEAGGAPPRDE
jgi:DNA-binding transcriptional LysR family regulator